MIGSTYDRHRLAKPNPPDGPKVVIPRCARPAPKPVWGGIYNKRETRYVPHEINDCVLVVAEGDNQGMVALVNSGRAASGANLLKAEKEFSPSCFAAEGST